MSGYVTILAIGGGTGLVIGLVLVILNSKPLMALRRARKEFNKIIREHFPTAKVFCFGGAALYVGNSRQPDVWITTLTDEERDELQRNTTLLNQFRAVLVRVGYPDDAPAVQFVFESQQTVEREFVGSWSRRRYEWHRRND
jgi:hypothetical protein